LPYPDMTDPILLEKMQSLDREYTRTGTGITGQSYYRSLCMRAVNQSIGRAIRHANDYASIILADYRYTSDSKIWRGLPAWLRSEVPDQSSSTFDRVFKDVRSFFSDK
jgi:chromosome transmission fidelity protein 1